MDAPEARELETMADDVEAEARREEATAEDLRRVARDRRRGDTWRVLSADGRLHASLERLGGGAVLLRRAAASLRRLFTRGLFGEGMTTREIGRTFGVSHQRISSILGRREDDR